MQNDKIKIENKEIKTDCMGNPEPSLSKSRIEVKCSICGKAKSVNMFEFKKNQTGHFYCTRECFKEGLKKYFSGPNNHFYGKKHKTESLAKISDNWGPVRRPITKLKTTCQGCGCDFEYMKTNSRNGIRKFCSRKCRKAGRKNFECAWCGKKIERRAGYELDRTFCSRHCWGKVHGLEQPKGQEAFWFGKRGIGSPNWGGGLSFEPYSVDFNKDLKEKIRNMDNRECQLCGIDENGKKLHIHHVDYNKKNNCPRNLISLCKSCHCKTNGNRAFYTKYFQALLNWQEGATTIPQGSTPQANGGGSAEHPHGGDDIVCSSRKLEAAS